MDRLILTNDLVECKLASNGEEKLSKGSFIFKLEEIPEYEIVDLYVNDGAFKDFLKIGDKIISASTGTEVFFNGEKRFLFKPEHIACKIIQ